MLIIVSLFSNFPLKENLMSTIIQKWQQQLRVFQNHVYIILKSEEAIANKGKERKTDFFPPEASWPFSKILNIISRRIKLESVLLEKIT